MMGEIGIVGREPFSSRVQETDFGGNHPMPRQLSELKNAQPLSRRNAIGSKPACVLRRRSRQTYNRCLASDKGICKFSFQKIHFSKTTGIASLPMPAARTSVSVTGCQRESRSDRTDC